MKSALIAGASGLTGKLLLDFLLQNKDYDRIFILVRKQLELNNPKLTQILFDYNNTAQYTQLPSVEEVFCCLGTTIRKAGSKEAFRKVDLEYPVTLAKTYSAKNARKFLLITALGANEKSVFFYNRIKGETETLIKTVSFESIFFCRPSLIMGKRNESRTAEEIGKFFAKFISLFLVGSLRKYKAIEASTLAKAMIELAHENKKGIHIIESDELIRLGGK